MKLASHTLRSTIDGSTQAAISEIGDLLGFRIAELQQTGILPASKVPMNMIVPTETAARLARIRTARTGTPLLDPAGELLDVLPPIALPTHGTLSPLEWIRCAFDLDTVEYWLLVAAVAPTLSEDAARAYAFARDNVSLGHLNLALFIEMCGWTSRPGSERILRYLLPGATLVDCGLLETNVDSKNRAVSAIGPSARLVEFLANPSLSLSHTLTAVCTLREMSGKPNLIVCDEVRTSILEAQRALSNDPTERVLIYGVSGVGKRSVALELASGLGRKLLEVDCSRIPATNDAVVEFAHATVREARLTGASLYLSRIEQLIESPTVARALQSFLAAPVPLFVSSRVDVRVGLSAAAPILDWHEVMIPIPDTNQRARLWDRFLPIQLRDPSLSLDAIVARYPLAPARIRAIANAVVNRGAISGTIAITQSDIIQGMRSQIHPQMRALARHIVPAAGWDQLIVEDENVILLQTLVNHYRHRSLVYDSWNVAATTRHQGVCSIFSGPSGTGKTLAATVVAKELGMELFQVDLAALVSKYIGETEKNLAVIFDEAEATGALLLFDEADSIFGKRTQVRSSTDRYANMGTNYLLQRIESFDGVCVLTTNLLSLIDEAFLRRIRFNISFNRPDESMRERLWEALLPSSMPIDGEIDFAKLASEFDMTGGLIKNAIVQGAFFAADLGCFVDQELLSFAARLELRSQGQLVRNMDIKEFFENYRARSSESTKGPRRSKSTS